MLSVEVLSIGIVMLSIEVLESWNVGMHKDLTDLNRMNFIQLKIIYFVSTLN